MTRVLPSILLTAILASCAPQYEYWQSRAAVGAKDLEQRYHVVQEGETLYLIALTYDLDYDDLIAWNDLSAPYDVFSGRHIRTHPPSDFSETIVETPPVDGETLPEVELSPIVVWHWPTEGDLLCNFKQRGCQKGLRITGDIGQPIYSTASGQIVYSGKGVRHYKSLILIKHADNYFSAYANNENLFVKTGDVVAARQRIASMGADAKRRAMLFFQIRKDGKPVNPIQLLEQ